MTNKNPSYIISLSEQLRSYNLTQSYVANKDGNSVKMHVYGFERVAAKLRGITKSMLKYWYTRILRVLTDLKAQCT